MKRIFAKGKVHRCCKKAKNLERQPSNKPEMHIMKCKVCGRNHYRLVAEPGIFNLVMK